MTVILNNPRFLINEVAKLGVTLNPQMQFTAQDPLMAVNAQFNGEADFGNEPAVFVEDSDFGSFLRHIIGRKGDRAIKKGIKSAGPVLAIASFAVPGVGPLVGGSALAALAAADKLLGDPKIKNAAKVISNTKALAALGDPGAKRGAIILSAAQKIRTVKKVPPGRKAIPYKGKVNLAPFAALTPRAKVTNLAHTKVQTKAIVQARVVKAVAKLSLWGRIKAVFKAS